MKTIATADVGGTHARFALASIDDGRVVDLEEPVTVKTGEFASFQHAWQEFGRRIDQPLPHELAIAFAGPVGGEVLKLMGDGVLAIFTGTSIGAACKAALSAEDNVRVKSQELTQKRATEGRPTTSVYLGLHVGDVFYGNIGSDERLDFTGIGPAVNEVCRIAAMCRSCGQTTLASTQFSAASRSSERSRLVSVGRYALRGVERPQELFTIDRFREDAAKRAH